MIDQTRLERIKERFARLILISDEPNSCWLWQGAKAGGRQLHQRYGTLRPTWYRGDRRNMYAHQVSWLLYNGDIPEKINVLHACDIPLCVNPTHLFLGTQKTNMLDAAFKNRTTYGIKNARAKLSEADIATIFSLREHGLLHREIAEKFGVSRSAISLILEGVNWPRGRRSR